VSIRLSLLLSKFIKGFLVFLRTYSLVLGGYLSFILISYTIYEVLGILSYINISLLLLFIIPLIGIYNRIIGFIIPNSDRSILIYTLLRDFNIFSSS